MKKLAKRARRIGTFVGVVSLSYFCAYGVLSWRGHYEPLMWDLQPGPAVYGWVPLGFLGARQSAYFLRWLFHSAFYMDERLIHTPVGRGDDRYEALEARRKIQSEADGTSNGSQPIGSVTNRTSTAAGSRR